MESTLQLEIVTPDKVVVSQTVDYVGVAGDRQQGGAVAHQHFGVLPHHIALLSALAIGDLYFRVDGKTEHVFVSGGFAEVSDNKLSILAESAERGEDIDTARANAARERAEARLAAKTAETDMLRAHLALQRAVERLHIASLV